MGSLLSPSRARRWEQQAEGDSHCERSLTRQHGHRLIALATDEGSLAAESVVMEHNKRGQPILPIADPCLPSPASRHVVARQGPGAAVEPRAGIGWVDGYASGGGCKHTHTHILRAHTHTRTPHVHTAGMWMPTWKPPSRHRQARCSASPSRAAADSSMHPLRGTLLCAPWLHWPSTYSMGVRVPRLESRVGCNGNTPVHAACRYLEPLT